MTLTTTQLAREYGGVLVAKPRNRLRRTFVTLLLVSIFAGAAAQQEAQTGETWDLVYLGESWLPDASREYATLMGNDLGITVQPSYQHPSFASPPLGALQQQLYLLDVVKDAEVITIHLDPHYPGASGYCEEAGGDQAYPLSAEEFRAQVDAFLAELTNRADPQETIIRIVTSAVLPVVKTVWLERDLFEECLAGWMELNEQWDEGAAAYGIPVVDTLTAWNGPDGLEDAPPEYFSDGGHLSAEGYAAVAELMRALGYAPLAP